MTLEQKAEYEAFCTGYEQVRLAEGWGGADLDLPFDPMGHHDIWKVRQQTFRRLDGLVQKECPSGGAALDVGAGNCWLTRYLDHWGFEATALDVNDGVQDGLAAGSSYLECGDSFERIRATMEPLPFVDGTFDLVVASGSLHYCQSLVETLGEFKRVAKPSGLIVVMDSPWFEREKNGIRSWERSVRDLVDRHGLDEILARRASFLDRVAFDAAVREAGLEYRKMTVWLGRARVWETVSARFYERRIASFPLLVIRRAL